MSANSAAGRARHRIPPTAPCRPRSSARHCSPGAAPSRATATRAFGRPDVEIDDVLVALIDQRRDRPAAQIVEPAAPQRKSLGGEVLDRRGEIDAAVEPGLDRVLVARRDIFEMAGLHGADMAGDDLLGEARFCARATTAPETRARRRTRRRGRSCRDRSRKTASSGATSATSARRMRANAGGRVPVRLRFPPGCGRAARPASAGRGCGRSAARARVDFGGGSLADRTARLCAASDAASAASSSPSSSAWTSRTLSHSDGRAHAVPPSPARASNRRARNSRDITVPIGVR